MTRSRPITGASGGVGRRLTASPPARGDHVVGSVGGVGSVRKPDAAADLHLLARAVRHDGRREGPVARQRQTTGRPA